MPVWQLVLVYLLKSKLSGRGRSCACLGSVIINESLCRLGDSRGFPGGCSSSLGLSCFPVSASGSAVSAAGVSRGTTAAHSTRPRSAHFPPPCAGLCNSSEEAAEDAGVATGSSVPAQQLQEEDPPTGSGTQRSQLWPGQSSSGSGGQHGWSCGMGGDCFWG